MRKGIYIIIVVFLVFAADRLSAHLTRKNLLFISSYSPSFPTFNQQLDGIRSAFTGDNIILDVEFMDTKRIPGKESISYFERMITFKFKHIPRYDAVIVADDAAYQFALSHSDTLFKGIPVFFCGVNDIEKARKSEKYHMIRGVVEAVSMEETAKLIPEMFPGRKRLAVIADGTIPGQADLKTFIHVSRDLPVTYEILSLQDLTFNQLYSRIGELGDDYSILLLSAYTDMTGYSKSFKDVFYDIRRYSRVPIFHLWEHGLGDGVLGGKIIRHYEQGRGAALMAISYFDGVPVKSIGNIYESPNRYMFDFKELKRFDVQKYRIPDGSIIINRSPKFYEVYKKTIFGIIICIVAMVYFSVIMIVNSQKLKRIIAEKTEELARSETRWRVSLECAGHDVWDWDIISNKIYISRKLNPEYNFFSEETIQPGNIWFDEVYEDDRAALNEKMMAHLKGETPLYENIHRLKGREGKYWWVLSRGKVTERLPDGRAARIIGTATDITAMKDIEDEVKRSRRMLQIVLDNTPIGIFWKDRDLNYLGCSKSFAKLVGKSSVDEIIGKKNIDLFDPALVNSFDRIDREIIETGISRLRYDDQELYPDGSIKYVRKSKVPLTDENGSIIGVLGIYEDVTEQRKLREENLRIQKLESVGILASGIAHDFNNLLMGIYGALMIVKESGELGEKNRLWIDNAEKSCLTAADLTTRIITFSKGGDPVFQRERLNVVINEAIRSKNAGQNITINYRDELTSPEIMIDGRQIRQVLLNILKNAIEAMPQGGVIDVVSSGIILAGDNRLELPAGSYAAISVSDTGSGIPESMIGKIFDPYFSTKEMGINKGQGLGLAICHSIILKHGGRITVSSSSGEGSVFTVYIPFGS